MSRQIDLRGARVADYCDAPSNSRDAQAIAEQFTEDAVQADPVSNPPNVGREAIAAFFADGIAASDSWRFEAKAVHTCGDHVAIDFQIAVVTAGQTMTIDGIEVFDRRRRRSVHRRPRLLGRCRSQLRPGLSRSPERSRTPESESARTMQDSSVELANLIARYAECIDQGDFDGHGRSAGPRHGRRRARRSLLTGREAIRKLFASTTRLYPDGTPRTKHVTTNLILEIDEAAERRPPARTGRCSRPSTDCPSSPSWPAAISMPSSVTTVTGGSASVASQSTWSATSAITC